MNIYATSVDEIKTPKTTIRTNKEIKRKLFFREMSFPNLKFKYNFDIPILT